MVGETRPEKTGVQFEGYIAELREFFASRDVRFGQPEDVVLFATRVAAPSPFEEEVGSIVRSILYSEDERLGEEDLQMLLAVAVGGPTVEPSMPGLQEALRTLFGFVHRAFRQRGGLPPWKEDEADSDPVLDEAPVDLFMPARTERMDLPVAQAVQPVNGMRSVYREPGSPAGYVMPSAGAFGQPESSHESVLFRAVSMAASEGASAEAKVSRAADPKQAAATSRAWVLPVAAFAGAAAAVLIFLLWPALMHRVSTRRGGVEATTAGISATSETPVAVRARPLACVGAGTPGVSRAGLEERSVWAHNLMDQQMYSAALQQVRTIAEVDPGFPGVRLDESNALLQMKQPDDARVAIDAQINLSECLSKLPTGAMDAYCAEQFTPSTVAACRPQLAHIRQAAQLQAALVHLELSHGMDADNQVAVAMAVLTGEGAAKPAAVRSAPMGATAHGRRSSAADVVRRSGGMRPAAPVVRVERSTRPIVRANSGDAP